RVGGGYALRVEAVFADDSAEDVTALCTFEARDKTIVAVDAAGRVTARGVGDTAVVARYRGQPAVADVLVAGDATGAFPEVNPCNFIDRHILDKLRRLHVHPSDLCDDATFLRRACLDVTGTLPTAEEVRDFVADPRVDRRARKVEELLARPGHAALWATRFCDVLPPSRFDARLGLVEAAGGRPVF